MILKASQRGGAKQLGVHLQRMDDNEHVEIHEIRGFVSDDLIGALKEAYAVSKGTRCKQFLFSVSLNPPQNERVAVETFEDAIGRIEQRTGLVNHPRIIVFHEKEGRRHAHAVWSRIDAESMTARNLPFFKLKLRDLSREIYLEQDWKMPRGLLNSREADPRNFSLKEWQQAKRMGSDARDLKDLMRECWAVSDSKAAYIQALKSRGFTLARGDRRGHVAVSPEGEVLSITRYTGKKTKEIRARLGETSGLPSVEEARQALAQDLKTTFRRHLKEADQLKRRSLAPLEIQRQAMVEAHRRERAALKEKQGIRWSDEARTRSGRFDKGLKGLWSQLTGRHAEIYRQNVKEAHTALMRDRAQRQALIDGQMHDRQSLQEKIKAARDRHAALLKELRNDQTKIADKARSESSRNPKIEERIARQRSNRDGGKVMPSRSLDRDR